MPRIPRLSTRLAVLLAAALAAFTAAAVADEGMWTFDNFPRAAVQQKLGVDIGQPWLDRVRVSTVRLSNCTASFISKDGLMLTNHHCAAQCLSEISSPGQDRLNDGFDILLHFRHIPGAKFANIHDHVDFISSCGNCFLRVCDFDCQ
jgi:hypothetical protein